MTTVNTIKDSYVDNSSPTTNFGTSIAIEVDSNATQEGLVEFNISGITNISVATLNLFVIGSDFGTETYNVNRITDDTWTEAGVTWNTKPTSTTTNQSSLSINDSVSVWRSWDVTSLVQDALNLGHTVVGFYIVGTGGTLKEFASRDHPASNIPYLTYTVINDVFVHSLAGSDVNSGLVPGSPKQTFGAAYSILNDAGTIHVLNAADFSSESVVFNKSLSTIGVSSYSLPSFT